MDPNRYTTDYISQTAPGGFEAVLVAIRREQVVRSLRRNRAARVLEVGCGLEPVFAHLEGFQTWTVVEPLPVFAKRARELSRGDPRVRILDGYLETQGSALTLGEFDFLILSSILHEVPDPSLLLRCVRDLCDAGTTIHVNVPNAASFHRLLAVEMGIIDEPSARSELDERFDHRRPLERPELERLVISAGFKIVDTGSYFVKPFTHAQMGFLLDSGRFPASLVKGLAAMTKFMPEHGCEIYVDARRT